MGSTIALTWTEYSPKPQAATARQVFAQRPSSLSKALNATWSYEFDGQVRTSGRQIGIAV